MQAVFDPVASPSVGPLLHTRRAALRPRKGRRPPWPFAGGESATLSKPSFSQQYNGPLEAPLYQPAAGLFAPNTDRRRRQESPNATRPRRERCAASTPCAPDTGLANVSTRKGSADGRCLLRGIVGLSSHDDRGLSITRYGKVRAGLFRGRPCRTLGGARGRRVDGHPRPSQANTKGDEVWPSPHLPSDRASQQGNRTASWRPRAPCPPEHPRARTDQPRR